MAGSLSWSVHTALTKYHSGNSLLTVLEAGSQGHSASLVGFWGRPPSDLQTSCILTGQEGLDTLRGLFHKSTTPIHEGSTLDT